MATPKWKCARCGVPCITWLNGWKHAGGWNTPKSCGKPPQPIRVEPLRERLCAPVSVDTAARLLAA